MKVNEMSRRGIGKVSREDTEKKKRNNFDLKNRKDSFSKSLFQEQKILFCTPTQD